MSNKLDDMKKDYENIEIPKELESMVKKTIEEAKKEKRKSKVIRFTAKIGGVAAAAMLTITVLTNSSASISYAMEQMPIIGAIAKVVTFRTYERTDKGMSANIQIPEVSVEDKEGNVMEEPTRELNKTVKEYTDQIIKMYEEDLAATGGEGHEDITTNYEVLTDNDQLFSLKINTTIALNTSGEEIKIYHIDKKTGQIFTLKDLFKEGAEYKSVITEYIQKKMREEMKEDEMKTYLIDVEVEGVDWTGITDNTNFYINDAGKLVTVFDKYEVAPGYMGVIEFEIPTEVIADILQDGFVK